MLIILPKHAVYGRLNNPIPQVWMELVQPKQSLKPRCRVNKANRIAVTSLCPIRIALIGKAPILLMLTIPMPEIWVSQEVTDMSTYTWTCAVCFNASVQVSRTSWTLCSTLGIVSIQNPYSVFVLSLTTSQAYFSAFPILC